MNEHPQFAEALALYAVGAMDNPQELAELQAHLGTCGTCRRELEALRADTALLALSTMGPKPPERARQRLLTAIAAEPRMERKKQKPYVVGRLRSRWLSFAPIAVMLMLAIFSLLLWRDLRNTRFQLRQARLQLERVQAQFDEMTPKYEQAEAVSELLHAPDAQPLLLVGTKTKPQPQMKVIYSKQKGTLFLMANNCSPPPPNKVYELWLLPADGSAPMPAGTFKSDANGNGMMLHPMETAGISAKGFAVTIEQEGGSQTPTMPIVMAPAS